MFIAMSMGSTTMIAMTVVGATMNQIAANQSDLLMIKNRHLMSGGRAADAKANAMTNPIR
jgi:hypothetical protein